MLGSGSKARSSRYIVAHDAAETAKAGLWAGTFTEPERWRRGAGGSETIESAPAPSSSATTKGPDAGCLIKGNVSESGERIYHVPGGAYYDRTKISPAKGERWFCTEAEALAAGWRRSKR